MLAQFVLQRLGSVVGTKDFGRESVHELFEVVVEQRRVQLGEDLVRLFLLLAKGLEIVVDLRSHAVVFVVHGGTKVNRLFEQHGILTEKLELDFPVVSTLFVGVKVKVLDAERAATHGIGLFVRVFFATHTERQTINDPDGRGELFGLEVFRFEVLFVALANGGNVLAEQRGFAVLRAIRFALEGGLRRELHVFGLQQK